MFTTAWDTMILAVSETAEEDTVSDTAVEEDTTVVAPTEEMLVDELI
jgi:hypothetical protein